MKKKSYMVAVKRKVTVDAVVYAEVVATSEKEAVKLSKKIKIKDEDFIEEAKVSLNCSEGKMSKSKYEGCGRANQYHSANECKICQAWERVND